MSFWHHKSETAAGEAIGQSADVEARSLPEDEPRFKREYKVRINERATMTLTFQSFLGSRSPRGELTQPDGRYVLFDPERVADKILDPTLVPLIEAQVKEIAAMDRAFMGNGPGEFVDDKRQRWVRA